MSGFDPEQFEAELARLQPARPPQKVLEQIAHELSSPSQVSTLAAKKRRGWTCAGLKRWLIPVGAAALLLGVLHLKPQKTPAPHSPPRHATAAGRPVLKADKVEIDRRLLADFDAIADLPSGQPVRFRCQQWLDKVRWRDSARGLVIEQDVPRLEIVPIRFETY